MVIDVESSSIPRQQKWILQDALSRSGDAGVRNELHETRTYLDTIMTLINSKPKTTSFAWNSNIFSIKVSSSLGKWSDCMLHLFIELNRQGSSYVCQRADKNLIGATLWGFAKIFSVFNTGNNLSRQPYDRTESRILPNLQGLDVGSMKTRHLILLLIREIVSCAQTKTQLTKSDRISLQVLVALSDINLCSLLFERPSAWQSKNTDVFVSACPEPMRPLGSDLLQKQTVLVSRQTATQRQSRSYFTFPPPVATVACHEYPLRPQRLLQAKQVSAVISCWVAGSLCLVWAVFRSRVR